ncbi:MAG: sensor histidine kinase [Chloroflexi bacterium]|nr:sensor histidine kinase [Chloroflexota bacterium]
MTEAVIPLALAPGDVLGKLRAELSRLQNTTGEIDLLLRQSRGEVETLTRREVQLINRQRQIQSNIDNYSRTEIWEVFETAREAQMRLFMMRSQVEQLENRRQVMDTYAAQLQAVVKDIEMLAPPEPAPGAAPVKRTTGGLSALQTIMRIIDAQESERQRLARQMHDGPATALSNLVLQAEVVERLLAADPQRAREEMSALKGSATGTFQRIRGFIFDLRPMMLDDLGLFPTLRRYVQEFQNNTQISTELTIMGKDRRLPSHIEVVIFRIIQELLINAQRHGNAGHIEINLDVGEIFVNASVVDDGTGFDVQHVLSDVRERKTLGIGNIIERVEMLGGEVHFDSALGRGTRVGLRLPAT